MNRAEMIKAALDELGISCSIADIDRLLPTTEMDYDTLKSAISALIEDTSRELNDKYFEWRDKQLSSRKGAASNNGTAGIIS